MDDRSKLRFEEDALIPCRKPSFRLNARCLSWLSAAMYLYQRIVHLTGFGNLGNRPRLQIDRDTVYTIPTLTHRIQTFLSNNTEEGSIDDAPHVQYSHMPGSPK